MITEETRIAAQFTLEWAKQLIVLSTGLLTISIAFTKDLVRPARWWAAIPLAGSWICFLISIQAGVKTIGGLIGGLLRAAERSAMSNGDVWSTSVADRLAAGVRFDDLVLNDAGIKLYPTALTHAVRQRDFFEYGMALLIVYGIVAAISVALSRSKP